MHASLLPRWRGAAPIQRAIEAGDTQTGACLMQMEKGLDTGPVLMHQTLDIAPDETAGQLHDRLSALGAQVLADGLGLLRANMRPVPRPQPEQGATYARKLEKAEARLDWTQPATVLARKVRAFDPWPIAEGEIAGDSVRIHRAVAIEGRGTPGTRARRGPRRHRCRLRRRRAAHPRAATRGRQADHRRRLPQRAPRPARCGA